MTDLNMDISEVNEMFITYGSLDFGINVPNSLIRSLMLNRRLLSTTEQKNRRKKTKLKWLCKKSQLCIIYLFKSFVEIES